MLSPSLKQLISTLGNLGLTGKEIAEAIWLASQTEASDVTTVSVVAKPVVSENRVAPAELSPPTLDLDSSPPPARAEIVPAPIDRTPALALPPNYRPIPVPDAPAISQALLLARALRPLARQIAVGLPVILDEATTVDRFAETGVMQLALKPELELWMDVALVFDTSPSMCLWQRLGTDVHRVLARYGEFRDVRIWKLQHTAGKVDLTTRKGVLCKPKDLLVGDRRRLIVILSDCVAPAWHNGNMRKLIATWSVKLPTVVFHVFPERLWARTALVRSVTVEFQGRQPGLPSDNLKPFARSVWDRERLQASLAPSNVRLPVVSLEKDSLSSWAQVVAGDRRARVLGIVWDAAPAKQTPQAASPSTSNLKQRLDSFVLTASPISRELAGRLASAPVITLPIVRIIKTSMRPPASAVHIAEVFMSGLLKVSGSKVPTFDNAEQIPYELVDEAVRDRLRAGSLVLDALDVFEQVSTYIAQGLGKSVNEFWALLRTPARGISSEETEFLQAFATVSAKVLRGLGSQFEAIAHSLAPSPMEEADSPKSNDDFPLEDLEYEVAKLLNFPALQPCDYESATITAILDRFDFETATFERTNADSDKIAIDWTRNNLQAFRQALQESYPTYSALNIFTTEALNENLTTIISSTSNTVTITNFLEWAKANGRLDEVFEAFCRDHPNHSFVKELQQNSLTRNDSAQEELRWRIVRAPGTAWGYTEPLSTVSEEDIGLDLIAIPGGSFTMGAPESEPASGSSERPQHEVTLQPFYLGRYPVTQAQWRVVAGYDRIAQDLDPDPFGFKGDKRPVERVSWDDAQEFCKRLSAQTGKDYRLPSEAQWEYACRAGTTTPFHFGETITPELVNYDGTEIYNNSPKGEYRQKTTDVGSFPANEWGLHDLHGNVWEWCEDDWHDSYEGAPSDGSAWVESDRENTVRLLRGGSWNYLPRNCRSAYRFGHSRDFRDFDIGCRVCCVPPRLSS